MGPGFPGWHWGRERAENGGDHLDWEVVAGYMEVRLFGGWACVDRLVSSSGTDKVAESSCPYPISNHAVTT